MRKHFTFLLLFIIGYSTLYCQSVKFRIIDKDGYSLPGANVSLTNNRDGNVSLGSAEIDGTVTISVSIPNEYTYEITYIGYETITDKIFLSETITTIEVKMKEAVNLLGEVKVVAKRPLIRQDGERTIVDPEPMLGSVTNTFELLTATPGLFVDQDGGVFLGSSAPAVIYINGREQRLSSNDIANILKSLPPDNILRIEIIRNPSTKYDAASSGGIVNVVLKKGVKIGRFGSANIGFNQGNLGNRFGGINLYDTGSKSGYYLNLNVNQDALLDEMTALRKSNAPFILNQKGNTERETSNGFIGLGYNHEINDKWSFTYDARLSGSLSKSLTDYINNTESFEGKELSTMQNLVSDRTPFINHNHDLGAIFKLDTANSNINFKVSLGQSWNDNSQVYENNFSFPTLPGIFGSGETQRNRNFLLAQIDVIKEFKNDFRLETGAKSNLQTFESSADFLIKNGQGEFISDNDRNNTYTYGENLMAAYGQISKNFTNKIALTTGVRMETTDMNGQQSIPTDTSFNVLRADFFPFLFVSRDLIKMAGFGLKGFLTYRKTLNRPSYQNLNPAIRVIDLFNYQAGNPTLKPQFTDNYEFKIGFDDVEVLAIGKNYTSGIISNVLYNDPNNASLTINTFDNIGKSDETYFKFVGAVPPIYKYFFVMGGQYNHLKYDGFYNGEPLSFTRGSWQFFTFHRYKITPKTTISMQGFMLINGQRNLLELGNFGQLNFALNQRLFNDKMTISIYARDVFRTMQTPFRLAQGNILFEGEQYRDNQRVGATVRYSFGVPSKKEKDNAMNNTEI
jgi:outer membrane receptor protein involved in Fe transport